MIVGFSNGCFDGLHEGHLHLLRSARARCDVLFVGVNTDASVRKLKGQGRPIYREFERCMAVDKTGYAKHILTFGEGELEDLIRYVRPNLIFKGSDYNAADVVGADIIRGWGGEVVIVPLLPGFSTTGVEARS